MEYKILDKKAYKLHFIKTDRFKTITIRVVLRNKIEKEKIALRNFLMDILTFSTENYPTRKELVECSQDLYSVNIYSRAYRIGKQNSMNFFVNFLNEKYTEEGMLEESIKFLAEILFHPNTKNKSFDKDSFQVIKNTMQASLKTIKDNSKRYSLIRMLEEMSEDAPYSYREYGYQEDFDKITEESLYEYYKEVIKNSYADIYVLGNFDDKQMEEYMDKYMHFNTLKKEDKEIEIKHENYRKKPQTVKEKDHFNQSKLSIGCKLLDLTPREKNYVLTLYNIILGGSADSKFFKNIREKHSICYYINSTPKKLDNLLLIRSGISKERFDEAIKLIKNEIQDMEKGNFTEKEIDAAKSLYLTSLEESYDNDEAIIDMYLAKDLTGIGDIEERKQEIMTVTKDEIIEVAKKVHMDTIYLLEGDMEDE